jgi:hypothetical protein
MKKVALKAWQLLVFVGSMLGYFLMKYGLNDVAFPAVSIWKGIWIGSVFFVIATAIMSCVFYCIYQNAEKVLHATRWVHNLRCGNFQIPIQKWSRRFFSAYILGFDRGVTIATVYADNIWILAMVPVVYLTSIEIVKYHLWMIKLMIMRWAMRWWRVTLVFLSTQMDPVLATVYTITVLRDSGYIVDRRKIVIIFSVAFIISISYTVTLWRGILFS